MTKAEAIDAANVQLTYWKNRILSITATELQAAYRDLFAAEALPDDPTGSETPPPTLPAVWRLVNTLDVPLTIQRITENDEPMGGTFDIPSHDMSTIENGQPFIASGFGADTQFIATGHTMFINDSESSEGGGAGSLAILPLSLVVSAEWPHLGAWGSSADFEVTAINGSSVSSGMLSTLDDFAAFVMSFFTAPSATNDLNTRLILEGRIDTEPVVIDYRIVNESLPTFTITLTTDWTPFN